MFTKNWKNCFTSLISLYLITFNMKCKKSNIHAYVTLSSSLVMPVKL